MSDFNFSSINRTHSQTKIVPPTTTQNSGSPITEQTTHEPKIYDSTATKPSMPPLPEIPDSQTVETTIENSSPEKVKTLHDEIRAHGIEPIKLKKVEPVIDTRLELAKAQFISNSDSDKILDKTLNHDNREQFTKINASDISDRIVRPNHGSLDNLIQQNFSKIEQNLRSKLVNVDKQTQTAQNLAEQLLNRKDAENELLIQISSMDDQTLLETVSKNIGDLRSDRYGDVSTYADLSTKKKALAMAITQGLRNVSNARSLDIQMSLKANAIRVVHEELQGQGPNSDKAFGWSLKGSNDIQTEFAIKLGFTTPEKIQLAKENAETFPGIHEPDEWKNALNDFQKETLNTISTGITTALDQKIPNRVTQSQQLDYTYKGNPESKEVPQSFLLNGETYEAPKFLGKGGIGLILEYTNRSNPLDKVVVKSLLNPAQRDEMVKEMIAHRHVLGGENLQTDDNIITMRGVVKGPNDGLYMVMDKAEGGDLNDLSKVLGFAKSKGQLPPLASSLLTQYYIKEAAQGLAKLQESGSMHNDIKSLNFLVHDGHIKLADLGSTHTKTVLTSTIGVPTTFGGSEWRNSDNVHVTQKNDMYALGVMLHMINGGEVPPLGQLLRADPTDTTALGNLKTALLSDNPDERITPQGILDSSYVKNLDSVKPELLNQLVLATEELSKAVSSKYGKLEDNISELENEIRLKNNRRDRLGENDQETFDRLTHEIQNLSILVARDKQAQDDLLTQPPGKEAYEKLIQISNEIDSKLKKVSVF
jgi:serine/threonine protein kinase